MTRRPVAAVAALVLVLAAAGCSSDRLRPFDVDAEALPRTAHRAAHAPYGSVALRRLDDRRTARERGRENYLNESFYSDELFAHPVPELVGAAILRDLVGAGVFRRAAGPDEARYLVEITISNFAARIDRDLVGFIPVIPSLEIEARVSLDVRVTDHDGRPFLDRRLEAQETRAAAAIEGARDEAARLLLALLAEVADRAAREADRAVGAFWRDLGRDPLDPDRGISRAAPAGSFAEPRPGYDPVVVAHVASATVRTVGFRGRVRG